MKPMCWTHPKFARLKIKLRTSRGVAAGILEGLWHITATFEPDTGRMPFSGDELMAWLEYDCTYGFTPDQLMDALVECRFLDCRDGLLYVHDWIDHRPTYLQDRIRQRRYRQQHRKHENTPPPADVSRDSRVTVCDNNAPSASASASASAKKKKPPLSPKGETFRSMIGVELPKFIDTPEVRAKLTEWLQYKGGYQRTGMTALIKKVSEMDTPERVIAAVDHCLANKYAGLFESKNGQTKPKRPFPLLPITDGSDQC